MTLYQVLHELQIVLALILGACPLCTQPLTLDRLPPALTPTKQSTTRACPVDHETGWRSQIRIEATSMVPRQTKSRLSYLVATARCWRSWQNARSTTLRCL